MDAPKTWGEGEAPFERLVLRNVRCFADADVALHPRVTVIIGENGAGKTTFAESLASLTAGEREGLSAFPLRHGATEGAIQLFEAGREKPAAAWTVAAAEERRRLPESRLLLAYGRYRRVQFPEEPRRAVGNVPLLGEQWTDEAIYGGLASHLSTIVTGRRTTTLSSPDNHLLRDLGRYLKELYGLRSSRPVMDVAWRHLDASVRELGHGLEGLDVIERDGRDVAVIRRRGRELDVRELSDGYQAVLVIVLDLVLRYVVLTPELEEPLHRRATVVIDEVDLHLHPRWQRRVVRQLAKLFPGTQFILTTHSPAVVQGAIDDGHEVLVLREESSSVVPQPLDDKDRRALKGAQIDSVLVDERLFESGSRYSPRYEAVERSVRRLRKKVEAGTATDEDRDKLLRKLDRLEALVVAEEKRQADGVLISELAKVQLASLKRLAELTREAERGAT